MDNDSLLSAVRQLQQSMTAGSTPVESRLHTIPLQCCGTPDQAEVSTMLPMDFKPELMLSETEWAAEEMASTVLS